MYDRIKTPTYMWYNANNYQTSRPNISSSWWKGKLFRGWFKVKKWLCTFLHEALKLAELRWDFSLSNRRAELQVNGSVPHTHLPLMMIYFLCMFAVSLLPSALLALVDLLACFTNVSFSMLVCTCNPYFVLRVATLIWLLLTVKYECNIQRRFIDLMLH